MSAEAIKLIMVSKFITLLLSQLLARTHICERYQEKENSQRYVDQVLHLGLLRFPFGA